MSEEFNKKVMLPRRRVLRGKGFCAWCERPLIGSRIDYPNAHDCAEFFGGHLEEGDAICFWCIEDWGGDPTNPPIHGHA